MANKTFNDTFRKADGIFMTEDVTFGEKVGKYAADFVDSLLFKKEISEVFGASDTDDLEKLERLIASLKSIADQMRG